jgi:hypothetical protein
MDLGYRRVGHVYSVYLLTPATVTGHLRCGERGAPDHGGVRVILQRAAGVMVAYSCDLGYRRVGHVYSVCLRGVWTTPLPECVPTTRHAGLVKFIYLNFSLELLSLAMYPDDVITS